MLFKENEKWIVASDKEISQEEFDYFCSKESQERIKAVTEEINKRYLENLGKQEKKFYYINPMEEIRKSCF